MVHELTIIQKDENTKKSRVRLKLENIKVVTLFFRNLWLINFTR